MNDYTLNPALLLGFMAAIVAGLFLVGLLSLVVLLAALLLVKIPIVTSTSDIVTVVATSNVNNPSSPTKRLLPPVPSRVSLALTTLPHKFYNYPAPPQNTQLTPPPRLPRIIPPPLVLAHADTTQPPFANANTPPTHPHHPSPTQNKRLPPTY